LKILRKVNLDVFWERLKLDFAEVIVPLQEGGDILFGGLDPPKLVVDSVGKPQFSPKGYLFPQREKLFTFKGNGGIEITAHPNEVERVIWGIRPCDLYAIKILDAVYLSNYIDPYYQARRRNTLLIGLNCNKAEESCFCSSLGTGPFAHESFDLLFTDLGDDFLVEVGSKAGERVIENEAGLFIDATDKDEGKARALEEKSKRSFGNWVDLERVKAKLPTAWDNPLWAEEAKKCFLCGGCNFACPTCYCFNIEDVRAGQDTERVRYWDSCQLAGFTQMAAENSRRTQTERLRQRIYHKFSYMPDRYNVQAGCVGCGRCTDVCIVGIDIIEILGRLAK
jgi:ferredoxin